MGDYILAAAIIILFCGGLATSATEGTRNPSEPREQKRPRRPGWEQP